MAHTLYDLISKNKLRTYLFIIGFSLILGLIGYLLAQVFHWGIEFYILFALIIVFYNIILYYNSDKLALAFSNARPAPPEKYYQLHNIVEEVAIAAGVPKPKVYIIPEEMPNAFATGRNPQNASIAVTEGLLRMMSREELQGVIAHEMAHIRNYDILVMTIAAIIGGLIVLMRDIFIRSLWFGGLGERRSRDDRRGSFGGILILIGLLLAIVAPILVALIRAAISREREYLADASGAFIVRNPYGLASALRKIGAYHGKMRQASDATAHLFIANPFGKDRISVNELFATHPPLEKRIKRLLELTI
ncbi:MAG: zinc metalloprotease HtpX [candidate division WOR-3 bacterium]|nr:zinc metalloprotease HtpX [candidate division WOR-3 bacterium]